MNETLFIEDLIMHGWNPSMLSLLQNLTFEDKNKVSDMNIVGFFNQCSLKTSLLANLISLSSEFDLLGLVISKDKCS
jgi:hypothetical protein